MLLNGDLFVLCGSFYLSHLNDQVIAIALIYYVLLVKLTIVKKKNSPLLLRDNILSC